MGFHAQLENDIPVTQTGWVVIKGFNVAIDTTFRPSDNGPYNIDSELQGDKESIIVPMTGIYMVSASVPVTSGNGGTYQLALIDVGHADNVGLTAKEKFHNGKYHTLSLSAFVRLFAGEVVKLMIRSEDDSSYTISKTTSLTFHFVGSTGSVPAYLANVKTANDAPLAVTSGEIIKPWTTLGKGKLFRSLYGKTTFLH